MAKFDPNNLFPEWALEKATDYFAVRVEKENKRVADLKARGQYTDQVSPRLLAR